tara:strand:+ start:5966 stop:6418 length:453 start_codon:yes stop_codon:yes gene_type:complete
MRLIKAKIKDSNFFFNLRNSPEVRRNSLNKKKLNLKNHQIWFEKAIKRDKTYKIVDKQKKDCGYVRLKKKSKIFFVSISVRKEFRGKNLASKALIKIEKLVPVNTVLAAIVKKRNLISKNLFEKVGYNIYSKRKNSLIFKKNKSKEKKVL